MKRDRVGRLWPEQTIEHLVFWPLLAVALVAVYFTARWISDSLEPMDRAIAKWIVGLF